LHPRFFLGRER